MLSTCVIVLGEGYTIAVRIALSEAHQVADDGGSTPAASNSRGATA
jgi:hypothetical protein